jgi:hypothetical protein
MASTARLAARHTAVTALELAPHGVEQRGDQVRSARSAKACAGRAAPIVPASTRTPIRNFCSWPKMRARSSTVLVAARLVERGASRPPAIGAVGQRRRSAGSSSASKTCGARDDVSASRGAVAHDGRQQVEQARIGLQQREELHAGRQARQERSKAAKRLSAFSVFASASSSAGVISVSRSRALGRARRGVAAESASRGPRASLAPACEAERVSVFSVSGSSSSPVKTRLPRRRQLGAASNRSA